MQRITFKHQKGFTLIELLAVLAIVAVLAGIVSAGITGQAGKGTKASAQQDANSTNTSAKQFFEDQFLGLTSNKTVTLSATVNGASVVDQVQEASGNWPEIFITENVVPGVPPTTPYTTEFPSQFADSAAVLTNTSLLDPAGATIDGSTFVSKYTAVDFDQMITRGYSDRVPTSFGDTTTVAGTEFHSFLWLFQKAPLAGNSEQDGRTVALFQLSGTEVEELGGGAKTVALTYQQIIGPSADVAPSATEVPPPTPTTAPSPPPPPPSPPYIVNNTTDAIDVNPGDGICETTVPFECTLRAAVMESNAQAGPNLVLLTPGTYTLTISGRDEIGAATGDLNITDSLNINGTDAAITIIEADDNTSAEGIDRVFRVHSGVIADIIGVTIRHGNSGAGGGILNQGNLTLTNAKVIDNRSSSIIDSFSDLAGGGIFNDNFSLLAINDSIISGNSASNGGGINNNFSSSTATIFRSTISGNTAVDSGGGILNQNNLTVTDSTISGNTVTAVASNGGGLSNQFAGGSPVTATLVNSTISGNSASGFGGGISNFGSSAVALSNSTINDNTAPTGGGIRNLSSGVADLRNTIVSNSSFGDCDGIITSSGHNLSSDTSCGFTGASDLQGVSPLLDLLQDNGEPTFTHAMFDGSPAINAGSSECPPPNTDQRGIPRSPGIACDIGAYEKPSSLLSWWAGDGNTSNEVGPNNGTLQGDATFAAGKVDDAFSLDGTGDYVSASFTRTGPFTVEFWAKAGSPAQPVYTSLLSSSNPPNFIPYFQIDFDAIGRYRFNGGDDLAGPGQFLLVDIGVATTNFQHIAVTYDGTIVSTYLDGNFVTQGTWPLSPLQFEVAKIGINRGNNKAFNGLIDEVSIYNRALSSDEIKTIFDADSAGKLKP